MTLTGLVQILDDSNATQVTKLVEETNLASGAAPHCSIPKLPNVRRRRQSQVPGRLRLEQFPFCQVVRSESAANPQQDKENTAVQPGTPVRNPNDHLQEKLSKATKGMQCNQKIVKKSSPVLPNCQVVSRSGRWILHLFTVNSNWHTGTSQMRYNTTASNILSREAVTLLCGLTVWQCVQLS